LTTGRLLAIGPTRALVSECVSIFPCNVEVVVDRATGAKERIVALSSIVETSSPGVISPDGTTAAIAVDYPEGVFLDLVALENGQRITRVARMRSSGASQGAMVWSPDSRLLFFADSDGRIAVSDHSGRVQRLGADLPSVLQLALRVD
jgi:Tol biopolymer transport system component